MGDVRETEKDPDAFRTISEVADDLNLPQHVLRFWETRFPQIKPVKRAGGRRFYRPEDVDLLRGIRQLLYREGYTIKGVQKILKEQGIRHVQDIGVERDVAVMRSTPAERPAAPQDGVIFGGLLGLLPRRRKGADDPALGELPPDVELPLPFPDPEADRDLAADRGEPVAPLPPRGQTRERRLAERRYDDGVFEERIYEEREFAPEPALHREPRLTEDLRSRRPPPEPADEADDEPVRPVATRRAEASPPVGRRPSDAPETPVPAGSGAAPSFAPPRSSRPEPVVQRRPTRGPAAHVSTAPTPDFDDPLLPFLEHEPPAAPAVAPLDERIRRLKEQEAGPPEEYLPPKLRRRPSAAPAQRGWGDDHATAPPAPPVRDVHPSAVRPSASGAWPELARATEAVEHDLAVWHEHLSGAAPADDDALAPEAWAPEAEPDLGQDDDSDAEVDALEDEDAWADDPDEASAPFEDDEADQWAQDDVADAMWDAPSAVAARPSEPEDDAPVGVSFQVSAPLSARLGMGALAGMSGLAGTVRLPELSPNEAAMPSQPAAPRKAPPAAPPTGAAYPNRVPPASAPPLASAPPAPSFPPSWAPPEPQVRRVGPLTGPLEELPPGPAAGAPAHAAYPEMAPPAPMAAGPWGRSAEAVAPRDPAGTRAQPQAAPSPPAFWHGRDPFEAQAPAAAPIDPYLPPHLRGEPARPMGQGGVLPVLSRDDVHRLQAALYELGECRRLLRDVTEQKSESSHG